MPKSIAASRRGSLLASIQSRLTITRWIAFVASLMALSGGAIAETYTSLTFPGASLRTVAWGVDGNNVVGYYQLSESNATTHGFRYNGSSFTTLNDPLADQTFALGISGTKIVGEYTTASGASFGFIFNGTSYSTLSGLPAGASNVNARAVSGSNIVGTYDSSDSSGSHQHGFFYNGSSYTTLDDPSSGGTITILGYTIDVHGTIARGVSGSNVVGSYSTADGQSVHAHGFLYNGSSYVTLDYPLAGVRDTVATGISGSNIVGYYTNSSGTHGFLYNGSSYVTLDDPAASHNGVNTNGTIVSGISGSKIVGVYSNSSNLDVGFIADLSAAGTGQNRTVLVSGGVGTVSGAQLTFDNVTTTGSVTSDYLDASSLDQLQQFVGTNLAFDAGGILQAWDLSFSGTFSGSVTVSLHYDPTMLNGTPESQLVLWHFVNHNHWEKVANEVIDPVNHTISFTTTSFSPFVLAPVPEPSTAVLAVIGLAGLIAWAWHGAA